MDDDFIQLIQSLIIPPLITILLEEGIITEESSILEFKNAMSKLNLHKEISKLKFSIDISDSYKDAIENAINNEQKDVAITLTGILFEQIVNKFYYDVLLSYLNFSKTEYDACMKGAAVKDKLTWLYKLTTNESIDSNLISDIHKVCSARNFYVHYKPHTWYIDDMSDQAYEMEHIDIKNLLPLVEQLEVIFSNYIGRIFPTTQKAREMFEKYNDS